MKRSWGRGKLSGLVQGLIGVLLLLGGNPGTGLADDLPTVERKTDAPPKELVEPIASLLAPGCLVVKSEGEELARFWVRATIPSQADEEPVTNDMLVEGELLGVVQIASRDLTDFKEQAILPGLYTLRLGRHPADGNHMGIAPFPEFLCVVPVAKDADPKPLAAKEMMDWSKESAGTGHPTVLYLDVLFEKPDEALPRIVENDSEHIVLQTETKAKLENGDEASFLLALVIVGVTEAK